VHQTGYRIAYAKGPVSRWKDAASVQETANALRLDSSAILAWNTETIGGRPDGEV